LVSNNFIRVLFIEQPYNNLYYRQTVGGPWQDKNFVKWSLITKRLRTTGLDHDQKLLVEVS
jgi:hypothetical protein